MIIDCNEINTPKDEFDKCPSYELNNDEGRVNADRQIGRPVIVLSAYGHHDCGGKPLSDIERTMLLFQLTNIGLNPAEAIELGKTLIALGEDCKKYPDRRKLSKQKTQNQKAG